MQLSSYFNRHKSVTAFFSLLLLSVLNIAVASPLPRNVVSEKSLTTRAVEGSTITFDEYVAYLKEYYTKTDQYIEYSGFSEPQVRAFQAKNPGYYYYADFFDADNPNSHWYDAFGADNRQDDAEASGRAISTVATDKITVFGAAAWRTEGQTSFYATTEAAINLARLESGDLKSINHMAKDAIDPAEVMATEDANGLHYNPGYTEGTPNNSEPFCPEPGCDTPETNSERNSSRGSSVYGDPATQKTPVGDKSTPGDSGHSNTKTNTNTSKPAVVHEPGAIHI
jgi:hypothetical protein